MNLVRSIEFSRGAAKTRRNEADFSRKDAKAQRGCAGRRPFDSNQRSGLAHLKVDKAALPQTERLCAFAPLRDQSLLLLRVSAPPRESAVSQFDAGTSQ